MASLRSAPALTHRLPGVSCASQEAVSHLPCASLTQTPGKAHCLSFPSPFPIWKARGEVGERKEGHAFHGEVMTAISFPVSPVLGTIEGHQNLSRQGSKVRSLQGENWR